ncbi:hypothetical protein ACN47E_004833 [Coniothyrium glycines]
MNEWVNQHARLWGRTPVSYPNISECLGERVGLYHSRQWWRPTGPALEIYESVSPDISNLLNLVFEDTYSSAIYFRLYMIGRSANTAWPTIMFFCEEAEPRKKAKKAVEKDGILERLPGFRTGHYPRQPVAGRLNQAASCGNTSPLSDSCNFDFQQAPLNNPCKTGIASDPRNLPTNRTPGPQNDTSFQSSAYFTSVYYHASRPLKSLGLPIFVKQKNGSFREATANVVFQGRSPLLMSVSHVFFDQETHEADFEAVAAFDYDLGSGSENASDDDDDDVEMTSTASLSSSEEMSDVSLTITPLGSDESTRWANTFPRESISQNCIAIPNWLRSNSDVHSNTDITSETNRISINPEDMIELGSLAWYSQNIDCALITISNSSVMTVVEKMDHNYEGRLPEQSVVEISAVIVGSSHGQIMGRISKDPISMCLPHSTTFCTVYEIMLALPLKWGDCGAQVLHAKSGRPYGHVVMTSETWNIAYIMKASQVFHESGTTWKRCPAVTSRLPDHQVSTLSAADTHGETSRLASAESCGIVAVRAVEPAQQHTVSATSSLRVLPMPSTNSMNTDRDGLMSMVVIDVRGAKRPMEASVTMREHSQDWYEIDESEVSWSPSDTESESRPSTPASSVYSSPTNLQALNISDFCSATVVVSPQMFLPMSPIQEKIALRSIGRSLDPFRTMFQSTNTRISVEELKHACSSYFGTVGLGRIWVPALLDRPQSFLGLLYIAAVFNDVRKEHEIESIEAVALRQDVIAMIEDDFLDPHHRISDPNIIAVSHLVVAGIINRDILSLDFHEKGLEAMVRIRGLENLGLHGHIASFVSWSNMASSILRETQPRPIYRNYIKTRKTASYTFAARVPESPVYCPRGEFFTLQRSALCSKKALSLLEDLRMMTDLYMNEATRRKASPFYSRVLQETTTDKHVLTDLLARNQILREGDWNVFHYLRHLKPLKMNVLIPLSTYQLSN